jgi:hypothetical protein
VEKTDLLILDAMSIALLNLLIFLIVKEYNLYFNPLSVVPVAGI